MIAAVPSWSSATSATPPQTQGAPSDASGIPLGDRPVQLYSTHTGGTGVTIDTTPMTRNTPFRHFLDTDQDLRDQDYKTMTDAISEYNNSATEGQRQFNQTFHRYYISQVVPDEATLGAMSPDEVAQVDQGAHWQSNLSTRAAVSKYTESAKRNAEEKYSFWHPFGLPKHPQLFPDVAPLLTGFTHEPTTERLNDLSNTQREEMSRARAIASNMEAKSAQNYLQSVSYAHKLQSDFAHSLGVTPAPCQSVPSQQADYSQTHDLATASYAPSSADTNPAYTGYPSSGQSTGDDPFSIGGAYVEVPQNPDPDDFVIVGEDDGW